MRIMNKKISVWLAAVGVLFATSCTNDDMPAPDQNVSGEEVTVSFFVSPQEKVKTRSGEVHYPATGEFPQISDGTKAHLLIYAVYDNDKKLLDQYGHATIITNEDAVIDEATQEKLDKITIGKGQTAMYVEEFPTPEIKIRLMRNQTYHIAFWAQNIDCDAYDTQDLQAVKVSYADAQNNDELRDVFCHTESFTVTGDDARSILLIRPLAQINVGTAGYDYECAVSGVNAMKYLYSKISINGVSQYLDVVDNKVLNGDDLSKRGISGEATTEISFGWGRIPAYVNYADMEDEALKGILHQAQFPDNKNDYKTYKEQFLRVKLYTEAGYLPYVSWDDVKKDESEKMPSPDTEIFKYLSMCYVLVPAHEVDTSGSADAYGTTVDNITVSLATSEEGDNQIVAIDNLCNVPVQRNWRTNIVGKKLLTIPYQAVIDIIPEYFGEHNYDGKDENGEPKWKEIEKENQSNQ